MKRHFVLATALVASTALFTIKDATAFVAREAAAYALSFVISADQDPDQAEWGQGTLSQGHDVVSIASGPMMITNIYVANKDYNDFYLVQATNWDCKTHSGWDWTLDGAMLSWNGGTETHLFLEKDMFLCAVANTPTSWPSWTRVMVSGYRPY
ncbi:MAG: hypothetical protein HN348_15370 [Proteobacteria bacterium]|jgi:hypothetical protein|nr:hypothetical protein [Pseudomonadota bacterium]